MVVFKIKEVQINFPFEPYACQLAYMEKLISCFQSEKSCNGILESPTGTGKTLCLLCASLAWLEVKKAQIQSKCMGIDNPCNNDRQILENDLDIAAGNWDKTQDIPKIIFASRTHSQLAQAIKELKRTAYKHVNVAILGSRDQLCIHPQVSQETNNSTKVHMCRSKIKTRQCIFYDNVDSQESNFTSNGTILDIEDLVNLGRKHKACPYFLSRKLKTNADIIFMPYNYLLDSNLRKLHGIELSKNIVIFDEAHNLESICESSSSTEITSIEIALCIKEISQLFNKLEDFSKLTENEDLSQTDFTMPEEEKFNLKDLLNLKEACHKLEDFLKNIELKNDTDFIQDANYVFEFLEFGNITIENKSIYQNIIEEVLLYTSNPSANLLLNTRCHGLTKFNDFLKVIFNEPPIKNPENSLRDIASLNYKVHVCNRTKVKNQDYDNWASKSSLSQCRVVSYWCFNPGYAMRDLIDRNVKSVILTSGTLSPMHSFKTEMEMQFDIELQNEHVIEKSQIFVSVLENGPDMTSLNSKYANRENKKYKSSLGNTIIQCSRMIPDGILIFFPSYFVMESNIQYWKEESILTKLDNQKKIHIEPRSKHELNTCINSFYEFVKNDKGASFMAVCRGKVSEGLDFADNNGRAVFITGIPYPAKNDPRVIHKMKFLDDNIKRKTIKGGLSGNEWYNLQATRAVNQAIGRIIRHKNDFGAIILCDERFSETSRRKQLPIWIQSEVKVFKQFGKIIRELKTFFEKTKKMKVLENTRLVSKTEHGVPYGKQSKNSQSRKVHETQELHNIPNAWDHINHVKGIQGSEASNFYSCSLIKNENDEVSSNPFSENVINNDIFSFNGIAKKRIVSNLEIDLENFNNPKKKSKIIIKKSSKLAETCFTANELLDKLKKHLSVDTYNKLREEIKLLRNGNQFESFATIIKEIFTGNDALYDILKSFINFVGIFKEEFSVLFTEITGKKLIRCDRKKMPIQQTENGIPISNDLSECKFENDLKTKEGIDDNNDVCFLTNHKRNKNAIICQRDVNDCLEDLKNETPIQQPENKIVKISSCINLCEGSGNSICVNCNQICKIPIKRVVSSNFICNHIACYECWKTLNKGKKTCPKCPNGNRVRLKDLKKPF